MRGRSAKTNPANRFDRNHYEDSDEEAYERLGRDVPTEVFADASRTIIAGNESPDVGFAASINPYRGCEHACPYCLDPETRVLHADFVWRPLGNVQVGDELVGFDEQVEPGRTRKLRRAMVQAVWWSRRAALRLVTERTEVVTTSDHRWLQHRDYRWSKTHQLRPGQGLRSVEVVPDRQRDADYQLGYLVGLSLGDGTFRYEPGWRSDKQGFPPAYWRVAMKDREPLERASRYLARIGIEVPLRAFDPGPNARGKFWKIETRALGKLAILHRILNGQGTGRSYERGFVAGFFDAEGTNGSSLRFSPLRLSRKDVAVLERVQKYCAGFGFRMKVEAWETRTSTLRLFGATDERMRFMEVFQPSVARRRDALFGRMPVTRQEPVVAIEPAGDRDVMDIQTSTGTFYAAGLATHNCFARPTHEYLGLSAGLDFETKIFAKYDAPKLLRRRLAQQSWKPQVIAMSGVTDPYQPTERKLRLTRGCLEVLSDFRNPVGILTKSALVTRDLDVLQELARYDAASVMLSITTLDPKLQHRMEPRASRPSKRLAAVEKLADAGIPVGIMVAPVIPGLTDHETPAILRAAADAGATHAGRVMLRLPHGVKEIFERWLAEHYPDRKDKVLNQIRGLRGGKLYDSDWRTRQRGTGKHADHLEEVFELYRRKTGMRERGPELSTAHFRVPGRASQLDLFAAD